MTAGTEVFISHHHADETLALLLKDLIEDTFLTASVFVSGRDLSGGDVWINEIRQRLSGANVVISLITPFSVSSPWVLFESGAGFMRSKCIPLCADGITIRKLEPPLNQLHARSFTEEGLQKLIKDIAKCLSIRPPKALPTLPTIIGRANEFIETRSREATSRPEPKPPQSAKNRATKELDQAFVNRVNALVADLRLKFVQKITDASDRYDVPKRVELEKMPLSELSEVAEAFGIPVTRSAAAQLLLLQMTPLEAGAPKWKRMNFDKRLQSIENNIKTLSQFGF